MNILEEVKEYFANTPKEEVTKFINEIIEEHKPENNTINITELFDKCIAKWGRAAQFEMLQEEATELALAARRFIRGREGATDNLVEEIADTLIMIQQAFFMLPGLDESVEQVMQAKLNKLNERVNPKGQTI